MGLLSRKKDDGDEGNRNALFSRKKSDKAAPQSNPYAAAPGKDPYAQPPPQYPGPNDGFRQDKTPAVTGPGQQFGGRGGGGGGGGYGAQGGGYGAQSGYGNERYGSSPAPQQQSARGPGGYGGLGRTSSTDTDANKADLFGNAAQRQQQQQQPGGYGAEPGGYGQSTPGAYGDRELTAEEQEEEDIGATKQEIKFMKQQDVSSTRNALRLAQQAEETGRDTLARLGAQGERIHNTERNLDLASTQNRIAEEKARELKTLNKSMFAMHVSNPFTASSRRQARDDKIMENHHRDREARDATRKAAWESSARQDNQNRTMQGMSGANKKASLAERAKYQFEADSDDDAMENEIDANLDALHGAARRLNHLGRAMGQEVETQNEHIGRIIGKTDKVDDQIAMNRSRLERIEKM
ncbi:Protein transport protein S9 plasma membrane t-SNARE [Ascochyta clinopodiicola]|nr:Protein transport protein S9 plasma membrane t-SNARE [Ascochyta clinopodiicola]